MSWSAFNVEKILSGLACQVFRVLSAAQMLVMYGYVMNMSSLTFLFGTLIRLRT